MQPRLCLAEPFMSVGCSCRALGAVGAGCCLQECCQALVSLQKAAIFLEGLGERGATAHKDLSPLKEDPGA